MTDAELLGVFGVERDEHGNPRPVGQPGRKGVSERQLFTRFLFLNGITDGATQKRLWEERVSGRPGGKGTGRRARTAPAADRQPGR